MWKRHWGLTRDPFAPGPEAPFVPTAGHAEAVARLVHTIEAGRGTATLRAPAGLGKSVVLARALAEARHPSRRIARASGPDLLPALAEGLGARLPAGAERPTAWRRLVEAARLARAMGQAIVFAIDDAHHLHDPADRLDLERLAHLDPHPSARVVVLRVGREVGPWAEPFEGDWGLTIRLPPLTRGDADQYLAARLAAAGRPGLTFTPRAVARCHALSGGGPRGLDRLAGLALMAGALRGVEVVTPEIVDGAARECVAVGAIPAGG